MQVCKHGGERVYSLDKFTTLLKNKRIDLRLTQNVVAELSGINISTVWRIEKGFVIPTLENIIKLSSVYKLDPYTIFESLYGDPLYIFNNFIIEAEKMIVSHNFNGINSLTLSLEEIISDSQNEFLTNQAKQYKLFLEGVKLLNNNMFEKSKLLFIEALKILIKNFEINNFTDFNYSQFELRILLNLGLSLNKLGYYGYYKSIVEYCFYNIDESSTEYLVIVCNYCILLSRESRPLEALEKTKNAIKYSQDNRMYEYLPLLFYHEAICYKELNQREMFERSLHVAKILCESFDFEYLLKRINEKTDKYF